MVVLGNLKAAVVLASSEDPVVNRVYQDLAVNCGILISHCLSAILRHKGGVQSEIEVERRDNKELTRRVASSRLGTEKTLATFDFNFNQSIRKPTIRELAKSGLTRLSSGCRQAAPLSCILWQFRFLSYSMLFGGNMRQLGPAIGTLTMVFHFSSGRDA